MGTECEPGGHTTAVHSSPEPSKALSANPQSTSQHPSPPVTPLKVPAAQALLTSPQSNPLQNSFAILL